MGKPIEFPSEGRTQDYYANYNIEEVDGNIIVADGWICAPGRGSELMEEIIRELHTMASAQNKTVIHRFEASTLRGRRLIGKFSDYQFVGRSSTRDPIYEKRYDP